MRHGFSLLLCLLLLAVLATPALAQTPPAIGYMYPPGGQAGKAFEVVLGGYDWTPDMQLFVLDRRIKLELLGPPGPVIVPEPPYWYGKKARRPPFLLPRETRARLTIPTDVPPGVVRWQAANANGATATGRFVVTSGNQSVEDSDRDQPQSIPSLPATIAGQIKKIEEVDRYLFTATKTGPVTIALIARAVGSPLNGAIEIHNAAGRLVASAADTAGVDTTLTFAARAGESYTVSLYDVDFRGNRAFVYQLSLAAAPRVTAAIPTTGRRGETRQVEFVGYGIATGAARLESTTRKITFPADAKATSISYTLKTKWGDAAPIQLSVSDLPETVEPAGATPKLILPAAVTGVLDQRYMPDQYLVEGKKGDQWSIRLTGQSNGPPLDVVLTITDAEGKQLARSDDIVGTTDAALQFAVRADGQYRIAVSDVSGNSGNRSAVYRLTVQSAQPGFTLSAPELLNLPIGGKANIALKATRAAGFKDPIAITLTNLPPGIKVPEKLEIPQNKTALNISLEAPEKIASGASLITIEGKSQIEDQTITHTTDPLLVAVTIKPPFSVDAEGKDDVTKWPRGTTFPAPVLIEREEGFKAPIVLEMTSRQGRHRQGIRGPELTVQPGINRILYPVFLPEWLETTRTSRMVVNGVAKVTDPTGRVRYSLTRQKTRMGFLPTGALMKLSADASEWQASPGGQLSIPLVISRSGQLTEPVRIELRSLAKGPVNAFQAESISLPADQTQIDFPLAIGGKTSAGEYQLTIRATLMQDGRLPVVSETTVLVEVAP